MWHHRHVPTGGAPLASPSPAALPQEVFDRILGYLGTAAEETDFATTPGQRLRTEGHIRAVLQGRGTELDFERLLALSGKIARQLVHRHRTTGQADGGSADGHG